MSEEASEVTIEGVPEILATGFNFPEGPRWHDGSLWFSDLIGQKVLRLSPEGLIEVLAELDDNASGLGFLPDGSLLIVSMYRRLILRYSNGQLGVHADLRSLPCDWLNDMVVTADGTAYVGTRAKRDDPTTPVDTLAQVNLDGSFRVVAGDLATPNGIVVEGDRLIVAETYGHRLTEYRRAADGALSDRRTFAEVSDEFPDGICLDAEGGIWFGTPYTGDFIRLNSAGSITDRLSVANRVSIACALGGSDGHTLYMLSVDSRVLQRSWSEAEQAFVANPDRPTDSGAIEAVRVRIPAAT